MSPVYPISLVLTHQPVLVVGAGDVATRKVTGLLHCEARVTVVGPEASPEIVRLATQGLCAWHKRDYQTADLDDVQLVFVCTSKRAVNEQVFEEATARGLLVNVADCPELCSFHLPSVMRRGRLSLAVSTEGSSPLTARRIREELEGCFGDEMAEYLDLLHSWRARISTELPESKRLLFWQQVSESPVYEQVKRAEIAQAEATLEALLTLLKEA